MNKELMTVSKFDGFQVYYRENTHSFIYADFNDRNVLINGLVDYLFYETNLLNYTNTTSKIPFTGDIRQFTKLYYNISLFLNTELETLTVGDVTDELKNLLGEEYKLIDENGKLKVQKDKIGKIGEYAFHLLLTNFFQLNCILPKFHCSTDRNMSVFGIDTLFLDTKDKTIYFGESKFCNNIDNGINLINKSLDLYEQQILEEYRIVLANDDAFKLSKEFEAIYGESKQLCISFPKLIEIANLKSIGIPIFVAHGNGTEKSNPSEFIEKLDKRIKKKNFFGLETKYLLISLPVIDKTEFIKIAIKKAVIKQHEYEQRTIRVS